MCNLLSDLAYSANSDPTLPGFEITKSDMFELKNIHNNVVNAVKQKYGSTMRMILREVLKQKRALAEIEEKVETHKSLKSIKSDKNSEMTKKSKKSKRNYRKK